MSAAEQLGALGERANGPQTYGPEPQEWEESAVSVMAALPQIVAVVEAAERHVRPDVWIEGQPLHGSSIYPDLNGTTESELLTAALAALDEALS